jgi:hypothetical protein
METPRIWSVLLLITNLVVIDASRCDAIIIENETQPNMVDLYVFQNERPEGFRDKLTEWATTQIEQLASIMDLTEDQWNKLRLAAAGDVNRFMHDIDRVRKQVAGLDPNDQNEMMRGWQVISPLMQRKQRGLHDERSLYARVMQSVLTTEQLDMLRRRQSEQQIACQRAIIRLSILEFERLVPLTQKQRLELVATFDMKDVPPRQLQPEMGMVPSQFLISSLTVQEGEAIFNDEQFRIFKKLKSQYGRFDQPDDPFAE